MRIALVTEELSAAGRSGGIGAAIFELAIVLKKAGHEIDIYYYPLNRPSADRSAQLHAVFDEWGIGLNIIDGLVHVFDQDAPRARAYVVYQILKDRGNDYGFLHFHDYKGLGFFCITAKQLGCAFLETMLVVQLHKPIRWTIHANRSLFSDPGEILTDFLEQESIRLADQVISPSAYLLDWMKENGFALPPSERVHVIKNVFSHALKLGGADKRPATGHASVKELIFFGRHESRKGIVTFCDTLDRLRDVLASNDIAVWFVGGFGEINGQPSGVYLSERSKAWAFPFAFRAGFDRSQALRFLSSRREAVVVVPSFADNSPYTVVEAMACSRPVLTSLAGGASELIAPDCRAEAVVAIEPDVLAGRIRHLVEHGAPIPRFAEAPDRVVEQWLAFHHANRPEPAPTRPDGQPKVVVGITHFERPRKVLGAIMSVLRQTYAQIEVVVVDDGSRRPETIEALPLIESLLERHGGRLLRRENGYLGAARNTIARETESDFLLFLDDDDLLLPEAIERLVRAATFSGADIVNCLNVFMDLETRSAYEFRPEAHTRKASYIPVGGPLSLAPIANNFGGATALIKRDFFKRIGGYSELKGVGLEDYELYVRAVQAGADLRILPEVLYLYEVGRPSMVTSTPWLTNKRRVVETLDLGRHPEVWRDAIEVAAGSQTVREQTRHVRETFSNSSSHALLDAVMRTRGQPSEHVTALADYARAISANAAADAWRDALLEPDAVAGANSLGAPVLNCTGSGTHPGNNYKDIAFVIETASLLERGRFEEAADRLSQEARGHDIATPTLLHLAYRLAGSMALERGTASKLFDQFRVNAVSEAAIDLLGAVAVLAIAAERYDEAKPFIGQIEAREAGEYVDRYADIALAYKDSAAELALRHFQDHGQDESRRGFTILSNVAREVGHRMGRTISVVQLMGEFGPSVRARKTSTWSAREMMRKLKAAALIRKSH